MSLIQLLLAAFLAWAVSQDPGIEALVDRLDDESPLVREESAKELIKQCDEAAPVLLKRLPGTDGDRWKLFDRILQRCQGESRRRAFLSVPSKVTIVADKRPLSDALDELTKNLGFPPEKLRIPDRAVTVEIKDAHPLEALNRLCRAAGVAWRIQWPTQIPGRDPAPKQPSLLFWDFPAPPNEPRVHYMKNYAVSIGGMHVERWRTPFKDEFNATIGGVIQPSHLVGDVQLDELNVGAIVDDRGKALYEPPKPDPPERRLRDRLDRANRTGSISWSASIKLPDLEAKRYSVLGAKVKLRCEFDRRYLALIASDKGMDQVVEFEGLKLQLTAFRKEAEKVILRVSQQGRRVPLDGSESCRVVGDDRLDYADLRLRDGSTVKMQGVARHVGHGGEREYTFATKGEPVELRFVTYTLWEMDTLEFEFRDLPIPK